MTTAALKSNSQSQKELIRQEFSLLAKDNSPSKLIQLIEQFQLDPKCETIDDELIHYLAVGYLVKGEYLALKHLVKRYRMTDKYGVQLLQYAMNGNNEELTQMALISQKVFKSIKDNSTKFIQLSNLQQLLEHSRLAHSLKILSKYYLNIDLPTVTKLLNCTQAQLTGLHYPIVQGYIQLNHTQTKPNPKATQEALLNKMRNLANVAEQLNDLE